MIPPDPEVLYLPFDPLRQEHRTGEPTLENEVLRLVGGSRGFGTRWDPNAHPGWRVAGFFITNPVRARAVLTRPPLESAVEEWLDELSQFPFWSEGELIPTDARLITVDERGGPVYEMPAGWTPVPSLPEPTRFLPLPGDNVALDVFIPDGESGWLGSIEMSAEIPAAGVWGAYVGHHSLDSLPRGEWVKVELPLPGAIKTALNGDFPAAEIRTVVNSGVSGVRVRGLRTSGAVTGGNRPTHAPRSSTVTTTDFLDFEIAGDWIGASVEMTPTVASSGFRAARLNTDGWTEIESRGFATGELPPVTDVLTLDVFVPSPRPSPHWLGNIQAYLQCPSIGVWGQWLGQADLTYLFVSEWNTVRIPLASSTVAALTSGAGDCSLRFTISTAQTALATSFALDRVGFD
jgi:hypothetical protein